MLFFISTALADGGSSQSAGWLSSLPMIALIFILYFLLIRPQQKRQKQHQALVSAVKKGDKVITNSGIVATVSKVLNEQEIVLEIADGVHCKFIKSAIASIINNEVPVQTPAAVEKKPAAPEKKTPEQTSMKKSSNPIMKSGPANFPKKGKKPMNKTQPSGKKK
jgi:preprotein translocase subunit YajC